MKARNTLLQITSKQVIVEASKRCELLRKKECYVEILKGGSAGETVSLTK